MEMRFLFVILVGNIREPVNVGSQNLWDIHNAALCSVPPSITPNANRPLVIRIVTSSVYRAQCSDLNPANRAPSSRCDSARIAS